MGSASQLDFKHKKVQRLRKLVRRRDVRDSEGVFVAEGYKLLEEAVASNVEVEAVYVAPGASHALLDQLAGEGYRLYELADGVLERVADTVTPQPVLTVVRRPVRSTAILDTVSSVVVLVDVRDPGNAGTIVRSAEAAGIGAVVACEGSVDLFNPKTVRSSAGAVFHVPLLFDLTLRAAMTALEESKFSTIGTARGAQTPYDAIDLTERVAIVLGNEANGLRDELLGEMDKTVEIPIEGRSESLNVSMAASVLCFEVARQRRNHSVR